MKKKITLCLLCTALMCGLCGCNGGENKYTADRESHTVTTAAETEKPQEPQEDTETSAETTSAAETTKSTEGLTVSPSGYLLDPSVTLGEHEYAYDFAENQPCFIEETDGGVRVYGVNTDTEREWHYINRVMDQELFSTTRCVVLEHDGTADEFAGAWGERFGTVMSVYSGDFDGDGETEVATCRYDTGGTFCHIMELALYKLNSGHYEQFMFYPQDFNDKYINVEIDNEKKSLTLSLNGFNKTYAYDFSEIAPPEMTEFNVNLLQVNDFVLDGSEITYIVTPLFSGYTPEAFVDIRFTLDFSEGVFTCSDVEFTER